MTSKFWPVSSVIAVVAAVLLTWQVGMRTGEETFVCPDIGDCVQGSGWASLLRGVTITGPFIALLGAAWSRRLHNNGRLGPFSYRAIPDGEQILEVLTVLLAGLFTYWFVRNGPSIEPARPLDIGAPNTWALDIRNVRQPDGTPEITDVPSGLSWFIIGAVLFAPFAGSFGAMLGREFYGRRRRKAQREADEALDPDETHSAEAEAVDLTRSRATPDGDIPVIDLSDKALADEFGFDDE